MSYPRADKAKAMLREYLIRGGSIKYITLCRCCVNKIHGAIDVPLKLSWRQDVILKVIGNEQGCYLFDMVGVKMGRMVFGIEIKESGISVSDVVSGNMPWIQVKVDDVLAQLDVGNRPDYILLRNTKPTYCSDCAGQLIEAATLDMCSGDGKCYTQVDGDEEGKVKWHRDGDCVRGCQLMTCVGCKHDHPKVFLHNYGDRNVCFGCGLVESLRQREMPKKWKECGTCRLHKVWYESKRVVCHQCIIPVADCLVEGCKGKVSEMWMKRCHDCHQKGNLVGKREKRGVVSKCVEEGCDEIPSDSRHSRCYACFRAQYRK